MQSTKRAPRFFATAREFRTWLQRNHRSESELLVGFRKKTTGEGGITWREAVDQALCFGWVDGVRKRIDDGQYSIRFTPRRPGSTWSAVNITRVAELKSKKLMKPAGLAAFAQQPAGQSPAYSYERADPARLDGKLERLLKADRSILEFHHEQAPSYQRKVVHWIMGAKSEDTRERRLRQLIAAYAEGRRL